MSTRWRTAAATLHLGGAAGSCQPGAVTEEARVRGGEGAASRRGDARGRPGSDNAAHERWRRNRSGAVAAEEESTGDSLLYLLHGELR
jgi:hypothetical protein